LCCDTIASVEDYLVRMKAQALAAAPSQPIISLADFDQLRPPSGSVRQHLPAGPLQALTIETEMRFFVPAKLFAGIVEGQKPSRIIQSYFPEKLISSLLERFGVHEQVQYAEQFSHARIRSSKSPGNGITYELEFKAPKFPSEEGKLSRLVLPQPIKLSTRQFKLLAREATAGTVMKDRYCLKGSLGTGVLREDCVAEIDRFLAGGTNMRPFSKPLTTIDVELQDESWAREIRAGNHTFDFLETCPQMNALHADVTAPLSNRKLARDGLGSKQHRAIRTLEQLSKRLDLGLLKPA